MAVDGCKEGISFDRALNILAALVRLVDPGLTFRRFKLPPGEPSDDDLGGRWVMTIQLRQSKHSGYGGKADHIFHHLTPHSSRFATGAA